MRRYVVAKTDRPREFAFELALCSHLEQTTEWVLGRQLGAAVAAPGRRIMDVCAVHPGPSFDTRADITSRAIPLRAITCDVGTGEAVFWRDAFDCHRDTARDVVDSAVEAGFFESEWRGGREYVRQTTRYPDDWFGRLVGIENKPDLGDPGDLERQLRTDASLGLFDEIILATESYVTRAHLNRIPESVGVWRFDPESGEREVVRDATPLDPVSPGIELVAERPLRTDVELVSGAEKRRARLRLAERTYGKGWRTYDLPACTNASVTDDGRPYCTHFNHVVEPGRDCGDDCRAFETGDAPPLDADSLRDDRTPWVSDPDGVARRQSGLDRFW
ncbi:hypothetical protein GL213_02535 [Halogeometricum borinquense]|uniref:Uncharacterized protein n=1 Tax=Halogeometricum borinquense TaxID=60847 RepID=A0A6C0UK79_9EURY|nr:DUF5787 family protein [Halogeometricum borinquense]QIB75912.1 hypothetical protein G3I44_17475 [Halogeometricum borinquense]QIQ75505.1 hypothetical protein GL213_02535 [Halogeometricum borinquense]